MALLSVMIAIPLYTVALCLPGVHFLLQVADYMAASTEQVPQLVLLEALSSCPFLVKAAVAEAKGEVAGATEADLREIEAALAVLRVPGWREGDAANRPPFVRRNLLLLHAHMHRERLNALSLDESTKLAVLDLVSKARRLLDMTFGYCVSVTWVKAALAITELQALLVNNLWDHEDDDCHEAMKQKLSQAGLKMPKLGLRCVASDVQSGQKVKLKVTVTRSHAHSATEMQAYREMLRDESARQQQVEKQLAEAGGGELPDVSAEDDQTMNAHEAWWLMVEGVRNDGRGLPKTGIAAANVSHNYLACKPLGLTPALDQPSVTAELELDAPATPGEYKVIVHVRSSSMCCVDAKRKVAFLVHGGKVKRGNATSSTDSTGTSTEPGDGDDEVEEPGVMSAEELKALEAEELRKKQEAERKKAEEQDKRDAENAKRDAEIAAKGKRAAGGMHKFDPDEVDVHGGNATADDFLDAFGF